MEVSRSLGADVLLRGELHGALGTHELFLTPEALESKARDAIGEGDRHDNDHERKQGDGEHAGLHRRMAVGKQAPHHHHEAGGDQQALEQDDDHVAPAPAPSDET